MQKRRHPVLLLVMMLLQSILFSGLNVVPAHAEEISTAKKIISVVYDDSGSMTADTSWAAANYAMQAFAALLNEQDEMYITYMSDVGTEEEGAVKIDLSDVENAVKEIRNDVGYFGGTPLESVDIAMEQLKSIQEDDENTQFWLVILTDGAMSSYGDAAFSDLQNALDNYTGTVMSNGSQVYINYMGIGTGAVDIQDNPSNGLEAVQAGDDIVPTLSGIANKISGRMKFKEDAVNQKDGKTIQVHSDIPLYTISVFSQSSNAKVTKAEMETELKVERNIGLKYPEVEGIETDTSLYGNAVVITNKDKVIPAGDYTITFSEDVSLENTVIMYQPAIEMEAIILRNGITVDDFASLMENDVIDIEIVPVDPGTGAVIEDSRLPEGIMWEVHYEAGGRETDSSSTRILSGVTVEPGENRITCTMKVPDYIPVSKTIHFVPAPDIIYGIQISQPDKADYPRDNLGIDGCGGEPVQFFITGDGIPLTKDQLNGRFLQIVDTSLDDSEVKGFLNRFGMINATPALKLNDDGSFTLYPKSSLIPAFLIKAGTYTVTVSLDSDNSIQASGTFRVNAGMADWGGIVPLLILLAVILYMIYIFFIKAKFNGQTLYIDVFTSGGSTGGGYRKNTMCEETVLKKFSGDLFLPARACTRTVSGIRFIADGNGGVYIKKNSIMNYDGYGNSGANPIYNYDGIVNGLKDTKKQEKNIPDMVSLGAAPFYLRKGRYLYCIKIK